jgi:hypothetical protein
LPASGAASETRDGRPCRGRAPDRRRSRISVDQRLFGPYSWLRLGQGRGQPGLFRLDLLDAVLVRLAQIALRDLSGLFRSSAAIFARVLDAGRRRGLADRHARAGGIEQDTALSGNCRAGM